MGRFRMAMAAAVSTAMIVVAVAALDAVGADKTNAQDKRTDPMVAAFASCLRDRGVQVPALSGIELAVWLKTHELPMTAARACKTALADTPPQASEAAKADAEKIAACLRAHGFDAPTDPVALKQWMARQRGTAVQEALKDCGVGPAPKDCGGGEDKGAADQ